jgi:hypothetical protein
MSFLSGFYVVPKSFLCHSCLHPELQSREKQANSLPFGPRESFSYREESTSPRRDESVISDTVGGERSRKTGDTQFFTDRSVFAHYAPSVACNGWRASSTRGNPLVSPSDSSQTSGRPPLLKVYLLAAETLK